VFNLFKYVIFVMPSCIFCVDGFKKYETKKQTFTVIKSTET